MNAKIISARNFVQMNSLGVVLSPAEASDLLATKTSYADGDFSKSAIGLLSRTLGLSPREMVKVRCRTPAFPIDKEICIDVFARTIRDGCWQIVSGAVRTPFIVRSAFW